MKTNPPLAVQSDVMRTGLRRLTCARRRQAVAWGPRSGPERPVNITRDWTLRGCGGLRWRGPRPAISDRLALRAEESSAGRFCLARLGLVFGRSLCARRNTSKRIALEICEHRKLHFTGASLELNGANSWELPAHAVAQDRPKSSDELRRSSVKLRRRTSYRAPARED